MPVTAIIEFRIVPAERERFLTLLNAVLDAMRHEPMFHEAMLHVDPENENHMMLYETWEDLDDVINVQLSRDYRKAFHAALPEVLEEPRGVSIWHPIRADRATRLQNASVAT